MPISSQLAQALAQALGHEPSEELLALIETSAADMAELRREMQVGFERIRADLRVGVSEVKADLMKWSFVYWVGAVTTIAVLFRTLR